MADLNHKSKAELAQQIEVLQSQKQSQRIEHDNMKKRAEDKIAAYEKQIGMLNNELNRLNVMIREAIGQRDQARQALVEGTLNSTKLVDLSQPRNMAAANPN